MMKVVKEEVVEIRNEIIDVTDVLWGQMGLMAQVLRHFGKGLNCRGTLYYHFKSKEKL